MTGDRWFPTLPPHWSLKPAKRAVRCVDVKASVTTSTIKYIGLEHVESWTGKWIDSGSEVAADGTTNKYARGDVLFGNLRPYLAKVFETNDDGVCSTEFLVLRSLDLTPRYLQYLLRSETFIDAVNAWTYGVKMPRASWEIIGNLLLPIPPKAIQSVIADFLDSETAKADALVTKYERLIDLLEEKRTALITQAVTNGLDPSVPMKSGDALFIGPVPQSWKCKRLQWFLKSMQTGPFGTVFKSEDYVVDGIPMVNPTHFVGGRIEHSDKHTVDEPTAKRLARYSLTSGDILYGRRGDTKKHALVIDANEGWICGSDTIRVRLDTNQLLPEYLSFLTSSTSAQSYLMYAANGATMDGINPAILRHLPVSAPNIEEQQRIVSFLRSACASIDNLQNCIRSAIRLSKEHRFALITAAVTGQLDIDAYRPKRHKSAEVPA